MFSLIFILFCSYFRISFQKPALHILNTFASILFTFHSAYWNTGPIKKRYVNTFPTWHCFKSHKACFWMTSSIILLLLGDETAVSSSLMNSLTFINHCYCIRQKNISHAFSFFSFLSISDLALDSLVVVTKCNL